MSKPNVDFILCNNPGLSASLRIIFLLASEPGYLLSSSPYKKNTELHKRYFEYKKQLDLYNFWNQMKRIDYWMNLDGHEFEEAVASVYRNLGYKAEVSKQGGDGGIDIILTKENKRIAVQCKAHKKPVGPAVARDLFGTMNHYGYEEGILVSRNGFTVGVYEFVKDKPIKLVNLNDILDMTQ
jgi:restriction system protein